MGIPVWARFGLINVVVPWVIVLILRAMAPQGLVAVVAVFTASMLILVLNVEHMRRSSKWRWIFGAVMILNLACTMLFFQVALATSLGPIGRAFGVLPGIE